MDKKTYEAEYQCLNCKTSMIIDINFGEAIPFFTNDKYTIDNKYGKQGPICEYCGCNRWSHGKKPKGY